MKDFADARLPSKPMNLWPREIFKVFVNAKYFESAHGQLTSFIRHIAIKDIAYITFCGRYAAHGG